MQKGIRRIAYGVADFEKIQTRKDYYVDKTRFIPLLEENDYLFFIRPRRFGKSLWISILETYYDCAKKERFAEFFHDTWIGDNPTEEQGSYLVLTFDFSMVRADPEKVEESFEDHGRIHLHSFLDKYRQWFSAEAIASIQKEPNVSAKLSALFREAQKRNLPLYILIDEYDNFANTILSTAGAKAYHDLTHGEGFYRHFFAMLKGGTGKSGAGLQRLFTTGVSPVTMDDVTSGFNIGSNISLDPAYNEMVGFSEADIQTMLAYYQHKGVFQQNIEETLALMRLWYDNYRFGEESKFPMFNTDMVIYFVQKSIQNGRPPKELIDQNIRIDYGKLRHLMLISHHLNSNFDRLKAIIEEGEVLSEVKTSFPLEQLTQQENFISLLYYFGLLSFAGRKRGQPLLKIPNRTVQHLMYGYMREAYQEIETFRVDLWKLNDLLSRMAYEGEWKNFFDFLAKAIHQQTSIRDYLTAEKVIQGFLLAYLNISDFYISRTEKEMNKGFADIFLEPFLAKYPDLPYLYLIELKYLKRGALTDSLLQLTIEEAQGQLTLYLQDEILQNQYASLQTIGLILVFDGWELIYCERN